VENIEMRDVVKLKTGEEATILEIYEQGVYLVEIFYENGESDVVDIRREDIEKITYKHKK
jgi:hypothetical protein